MKDPRLQFETNVISTEYLSYYHGFASLSDSFLSMVNIERAMATFKDITIGNYMNMTERRKVTHHQCRQKNQRDNLTHLRTFTQAIYQSPRFDTICHVGIGGSVSGIKFIHHALSTWQQPSHYPLVFISNHDEAHIDHVLRSINIDTTLFIIVSKSGRTIEIQKIMSVLNDRVQRGHFFKDQCITVTTQGSPLNTADYMESFVFDSGVGGRFSSTSLSTLVSLSLTYGDSFLDPFLDGALLADENAMQPMAFNIALNHAVHRYYQQTLYKGLAIIPYGEALRDLPMFMLQLISESLGKRSTVDNELLQQSYAPIVIHGVGPEAQHTFFQQLHQSPDIIPVEFLFSLPQSSNQIHMLKQIIGQMVSLHEGQMHQDPHHHFVGNRPSTLMLLKSLSIVGLGYLVAMLENRIVYEGIFHNINPFDQPGVELGKKMSGSIDAKGTLASQIFDIVFDSDY